MLDNLSNRLQKILRDLRGYGRISDRHLGETMREIRNALLDADVHYKIAKEFVDRVRARALGQEVMDSLTPVQHVVKVVQSGTQKVGFLVDELIGQEEVVIKPLGALLHGTIGLSGATITGDGGIAIILDIPGLMRRYAARH